MKIIKYFLPLFILFLGILVIYNFKNNNVSTSILNLKNKSSTVNNTNDSSENLVEEKYSIDENIIKEANTYCKKNKLNENYFVLIDFKIHPGKKRLFLYDLKKDSIVKNYLVTHGSCDVFEENKNKWKTAKFSNKLDSHCSSLGKYKIGERGSSSWGNGIKYSLYGLESTNSNAFKRVIVIHSWEVVPDEECYPQPIALSWGCPAISIQAMNEFDEFISKNKQKNMLLWIIN